MIAKHFNYSLWRLSIITVLFISFAMSARAQGQRVSGTVVDSETGESLIGVTIVEVGTSNGTVTDIDGKYTIMVSSNASLSVSFVGFLTQTISVGAKTEINFSLVPDVKALDEIVVIGYGTAKRSELTGSVASVSSDDLKNIPVSSVTESLTGRLAGVNVTSTEGSPDAEINIRVRGGGSITQSSAPLYIVDGFPVSSISDITPSDIKSIDVLKDGASSAIYGSRGANGVIIITTKSGTTNGKMSVDFNTFYGVRKIAKTLDVLSPQDYVRWQYEYAVLDDPNDLSSFEDYFGSFSDLDLYAGLKGNDWQRQVYGRTGNVLSNDISIRGGTDEFNYSANYARYDEKAIMVGSDYLRNNFTFKLNNKPNKVVDIAFSMRYSDTKINGGGANEQNEVSSADSRLKHSVGYSPIPVPGLTTTAADDTNEATAGDLVNPLVAVDDNQREQMKRNLNLAGSVGWKIIDNLKLKVDFGLDNNNYVDHRFYGLTTYLVRNKPAADYQNQPAVVLRDRKTTTIRNANTLNYDFKDLLPSDHSINLLAGVELIKTQSQTLTSEIHGFPTGFDAQEAFKLTTQGKSIFSVNNYYSPDNNLLSYFGRLNYSYLDRYLLTATFRADGSSKFLGKQNRFGYFPSFAAAWKISEEGFMSGTSNWLNSLKLRASYGTAGNNNIDDGQTAQTFLSSTTTWINGFTSYWAPLTTLANPNLKWETTTTRNVGLDIAVLKGKLVASFDAYLNNISDLLLLFPISGVGYKDQFQNLGETKNQGVEVSLEYYPIEKTNYGLGFNLNMSFNNGEIVSLGSLENFGQASGWASTQIGDDYLISVGSPVGIMQGYVSDGRYEVSDFDYDASTETYTLKEGVTDASLIVGDVAPGMMKLKDLDGDGEVTLADQKVIGNANPKLVGGFVINGYAFGFDLSAAFNYSYGNDIYNANKIEFTTSTPRNQYRNLISMQETGTRWTNIDPQTGEMVTDPTALAALNATTTMWSPYMARYVFSDWAVEDGSFLRLNTLTLGYSLPNSLLSKVKIQRLRFYATGYNVFVLTKYSGFDPEVSTRRKTPLTPGVDYSAYPRSRMVVVGLNLSF
ncbi:MAG: TonB-dependent receptor [Cyclobacteriaceae bacterium]|nr:TonB-dependent receptor [Cyclobacteriaceae bacterium]